jgi:probable phosphoglycerate mutase
MVDNLPSYLAAADAAVCMGGYNTTCELLALAVPAVIIPRVRPRQEQQMRAERLEARGLVSCLHPGELSADTLADRIWCAAAGSRAEISERLDSIARRGVQTAADEIASLLPAARPRPAPTRPLAEPTPLTNGLRSAGPLPRHAAEVLLLRHAQTGWNDLQRRQGCSDQPLTDAGRRAAREWAARAPSGFATVCFSDLQRARETAAIIAAELELSDQREIDGLREQDQGAWTGLTKQQIKRRWPERLRERPRRPVGGEPPEALLERVRAALASIAAAYPGARVLAITHSEVIRTLELAMSLAAPPVPQLEGRWLHVQLPADAALEKSGAWLTAGELTAGRPTAHGAPRAA